MFLIVIKGKKRYDPVEILGKVKTYTSHNGSSAVYSRHVPTNLSRLRIKGGLKLKKEKLNSPKLIVNNPINSIKRIPLL